MLAILIHSVHSPGSAKMSKESHHWNKLELLLFTASPGKVVAFVEPQSQMGPLYRPEIAGFILCQQRKKGLQAEGRDGSSHALTSSRGGRGC